MAHLPAFNTLNARRLITSLSIIAGGGFWACNEPSLRMAGWKLLALHCTSRASRGSYGTLTCIMWLCRAGRHIRHAPRGCACRGWMGAVEDAGTTWVQGTSQESGQLARDEQWRCKGPSANSISWNFSFVSLKVASSFFFSDFLWHHDPH